MTQLQNGFYLGDALDLALFSIQSAMDQAMGIEFPLLGTNLNLYTSYVEQIRSTLSNNIRNLVLASPLTPVDDVRDAIFATLGNNPGGLGYLTDESQITVNLYSGSSTATAFDFNQVRSRQLRLNAGWSEEHRGRLSHRNYVQHQAGRCEKWRRISR